jgi:hypothetical protein
MVFSDVLQRFVEHKPVCVMVRATLESQFSARRLDALFDGTAQRQYTKELLFSTCVDLLCQVTLCGQPSVHAAFKQARADIPASLVAVYAKLQRTEPAVCEALVAETATAVAEVLGHLGVNRPEPVRGCRLRVVDGNVLAGTQHRLKELRGSNAAALPGLTLAVYEPSTGLVRQVVACPDGHANERRLLPRLEPLIEAGDLWLGDRSFATSDFLTAVDRRRARFLVRRHAGLKLLPVSPRRRAGSCRTGMVYEQPVRLSCGLTCRAIIIERKKPLRQGGRQVVLLTNVPRRQASARKLAALYLDRWQIEEAFRQLTQYLSCEVRTLGYPQAALLAFSLAVMAYNCLACVQGALASAQGRDKVDDELSAYYLAWEVKTSYEGMAVAVPAGEWAPFAGMEAAALATFLRQIAAGVKWDRYTKAPRGPKKPVKRRKVHRGAHVATARLLQSRKTRPKHRSQSP